MDTRTRRHAGSASYSDEQIQRVITGAGLTIQSEIDSDYILYCPFHPNNRTPAGEVDKEKGTFFCFACHHVANLIELVMHVSGRTYFESIRFIKSKEVASDLSRDLEKKLVEKPKYVEYSMEVISRLSEAALSSDRAKQYFAGRHISEETMQLFKLGYSEKQDMVTVPVQAPDGMPLGFVGRSIEGKDFKNTPGLPKGKTLFNIHRVKSSSKVFVVESSFDAIRLHQCGLPAVATLGSNVSNAQIELLQKYFNSIIVVADNDEAGSSMKERIAKKLTSRVSAIQLNSKYKDVGDMPDEEIKKLDLSFDNTIASMLQ